MRSWLLVGSACTRMKTQTTTQSAVNVAYDLYVAASEVAEPLPWDLIFGDGSDDDLVEVKVSLGALRRLVAVVCRVEHSTAETVNTAQSAVIPSAIHRTSIKGDPE